MADRDTVFGAGQLDDGAAGEGGLPGDPRAVLTARQGREPLHNHAAGNVTRACMVAALSYGRMSLLPHALSDPDHEADQGAQFSL
jgi:hypothetical protein